MRKEFRYRYRRSPKIKRGIFLLWPSFLILLLACSLSDLSPSDSTEVPLPTLLPTAADIPTTNLEPLTQVTVESEGAAAQSSQDVPGYTAADFGSAAGGGLTVNATDQSAFTLPADGLSPEQMALFEAGAAVFIVDWIEAPSPRADKDGLGPFFLMTSCEGCHVNNGRGRAPVNGQLGSGFLLRLSIPQLGPNGFNLPEPNYGYQLQDASVKGLAPEGVIVVEYEAIAGQFADGTPYSLRRPIYNVEARGYGDFADGTMFSPRVANPMVGLGLLETVPEETILALADPDDANGDGISGQANFVWDYVLGEFVLGRFGWKANEPNLAQQIAGAFNGDLGITSEIFPEESCTPVQEVCLNGDSGGNPEVTAEQFEQILLYSNLLGVPRQRNENDPLVLQGRDLFIQAECSSCHVPTLQTGEHPTLAQLSNQMIHPYTDLLLHDMGEGLADGRPDFTASGSEWRTAPLWGLGLTQTVNGHTFLLHDGRARDVTEAILWHGGEAAVSQQAFLNMSAAEREALLAFLASL